MKKAELRSKKAEFSVFRVFRGSLIVFLVAMLSAVSSVAQSPQTNLIARWSFDEGTGTNVVDSSGNGFNGVLEGMPLPGWTNGVSGFGLIFDGIQNRMLTTENTKHTETVTNAFSAFQRFSVSAFTGLTVSAWVKAPPGTTGEIVAKWSTNGMAAGSFMLSLTNGVPCFELRVNSGTGVSPVYEGITTNETGGTPVQLSTYHAVVGASGRTDGQWHFVAGTYDGKQMGIWWDGRLDGWKIVSGTVESVDAPIQIGLLNAVVDEVSLYSRALSVWEVEGMWQERESAFAKATADRMADGDTAAATSSLALGGYAEQRSREMNALFAVLAGLNEEDRLALARNPPLHLTSTMRLNPRNGRYPVPPGGYAELRNREMEIVRAALLNANMEEHMLLPSSPALRSLTTFKVVGDPNTRPKVQPGGYAEQRAIQMEAAYAELVRLRLQQEAVYRGMVEEFSNIIRFNPTRR